MPSKKSLIQKKARSLRLIGMDVDGVLTGGEVIILESGEEIKFWNSKDRLLLAQLHKKKSPLSFAFITGRSSKAVQDAADDLGIKYVVQGCHDKWKAMQRILDVHKISPKEAGFIGDDILDLPVLTKVGFSACPQDAVPDVKKRVSYVSPLPGGKGVVRDVLEFVLKAQKKWDPFLKSFLS